MNRKLGERLFTSHNSFPARLTPMDFPYLAVFRWPGSGEKAIPVLAEECVMRKQVWRCQDLIFRQELFVLCDALLSTLSTLEQILEILFLHKLVIFPVEPGDDHLGDQATDPVLVLFRLGQLYVFWKDPRFFPYPRSDQ